MFQRHEVKCMHELNAFNMMPGNQKKWIVKYHTLIGAIAFEHPAWHIKS